MPTLIDPTYFIRDLNLSITDTSSTASLQQDINFYEPEYFSKVWNREFYEAFAAGQSEQRFVDLKNGTSYGDGLYWRGLLDTTLKSSPIANYIYYNYVKNRAQVMSGVGATTNTAENSTRVSPADKIAFAWQRMVEVNREMYAYLIANADVYPEFESSVWWEYHTRWRYRCLNPMYNPNFINRIW